MKTSIQVENRREGELLQRGLDDPQVRAFVKVIGVLQQLPSDRARARVLWCVRDQLDEQAGDVEATR